MLSTQPVPQFILLPLASDYRAPLPGRPYPGFAYLMHGDWFLALHNLLFVVVPSALDRG